MSQPLVGIPPYRGNLLDYLLEKQKEEENKKKKASYNSKKLKKGFKGFFIIQTHQSRRLHYDLRIEFPIEDSKSLKNYKEWRGDASRLFKKPYKKENSVLRSWAIPKHKFPKGNEKILITETDDHAMEYADLTPDEKTTFTIPEGMYGAGTVKLADKGNYEILDLEYDKKYILNFHGKKYKGIYGLIKTDGKNWLLIKVKDKKKYASSRSLYDLNIFINHLYSVFNKR